MAHFSSSLPPPRWEFNSSVHDHLHLGVPSVVGESWLSMVDARWNSYAADRPEPNPIAKSSTDLGPAAFSTHSSLAVGSNVSPKVSLHLS